LYNISKGCNASLLVPSFIWWRQLVPGAEIVISASVFLIVGKSTNSPIFIERS